tara:strand:+ start:613 stop:1146 length:534 start_codon:yes stop_codon:yes gene_type:complete
MSNLRLINETTVSSSVSEVNVTDVFSSDFDVYKIVGDDFSTASTTATESYLRFIDSNGIVIKSKYQFASWYIPADTGYSEIRDTNVSDTTQIHYATGNPDQAPDVAGCVLYVFNPVSTSYYTFEMGEQTAHYSNPRYLASKGIGILEETFSITGFQFRFPSSNVSSGSIKTYGLRVD